MNDIATPGPINPESGQPDHQVEVSALKSWLRLNAVSLVITTAAVVAVCVFWDPVTAFKVVVGLGLVIFLHELGHFLAAKWCDVHVKTFSIGFGPAVPFCSYRWGETTYMLGVIPLGGYVSMVGEGTGESTPDGDPDDDDTDPRSFKNKAVGQRMLIISAGVIMNVILGMGCFVAAYLHGVREKPATVGTVESGSAAWRAGIRTDADIKKIGSRENPFFDDIRPIVMSTLKGEELPIVVEQPGPDGKRVVASMQAAPIRDEVVPFPQLGVSPPQRLTLDEFKNKSYPWIVPGSPAALANDPAFEPGDRIIGMTDPADPAKVTPLLPDPHDPGRGEPDYNDYYRRMVDLAEKPITFHVLRRGQSAEIAPLAVTVQPAFRFDLGMRMQMGKVAAIRLGGPADGKVEAVPVDGPPTAAGDKIAAVGVTNPAGKTTWRANGNRPAEAKPEDAVVPLDPILLPLELRRWAGEFPADRRGDLKVELVVLREIEHTEKRVPLTLKFDDTFRYDRELVGLPNSPLPVSGLGLAYWVEAVVTDAPNGAPAAEAGLTPNDVITAFRVKALTLAGEEKSGEWSEIKPHQWAWVDSWLQETPPHEIELRVKHGEEIREVTLKGRPDPTRGLPSRGLKFETDVRTQTATGVGDAIQLGAYRTVRFIKTVYQNLYGMIRGRVSPKTMSGPLTIANVSYKLAGEDFWQFLLFLGMISVNLAVVNFLPIPVLDGGHMVFLIIEKVLGRPVPERLFAAAMWVGLTLIVCLFAYVFSRDIVRLFL
jgi:regulator of sigma E protease